MTANRIDSEGRSNSERIGIGYYLVDQMATPTFLYRSLLEERPPSPEISRQSPISQGCMALRSKVLKNATDIGDEKGPPYLG